MKRCTKCGINKERSEFARCARERDGLQFKCKLCEAIYRNENKAACLTRSRLSRLKKIDHYLAVARAYASQRRAAGLATVPTKEQSSAKQRRWRAVNHERALSIARKSRAKRMGSQLAESRAWKKANHAACIAQNAKRRADKIRATPPWADLAAIKEIYKRARRAGKAVDHIVPLRGKTVCGLHVAANLQLLDKPKNSSKGNRWETDELWRA